MTCMMCRDRSGHRQLQDQQAQRRYQHRQHQAVPFKYKTSTQPMHTASGKLIALNTSVYFKTADVAGAIQSGLTNMGLNPGDAYSMVKADEYQMLNHTVAPKANALQCAACHGTTSVPATQMNLKSMGYALKASESVVCVQCHGSEDSLSFTKVHSKHVADRRYDCSFCHNFSRQPSAA